LTHTCVHGGVLRVRGGLGSGHGFWPVWGLGEIGVQKEEMGDVAAD
jgi:hypothetical protein